MRPLVLLAVSALLAVLVGSLAPSVHAAAFGAGVAQSVQQRHLIKEQISAADLLSQHADYSHATAAQRQFDAGTFTLGYLTPWNNHGYDVAKKFALKFTHISPVWYQIKLSTQRTPATADSKAKSKIVVTIGGAHDADAKFVQDVQLAGANHESKTRVAVVPRFIVEVDDASIYLKLAAKEALQKIVIRKVQDEITRIGADGMVLEMADAWHVVTTQGKDPKVRNQLNAFVMRLGEALHLHTGVNSPKQLIVVVRPHRPQSADFQNFDFKQVEKFVDGFSLMTYDHPSPMTGGPQSPLGWMRDSVKQLVGEAALKDARIMRKVMMGLPMYGMRYATQGGAGPEPILGRTLLEELTADPSAVATWHADSAEHSWSLSRSTKGRVETLFYPSLQFLHRRLSLAKELGVSISIWELGQGLDYFYDLF